jgi:hypothetical protein
MYTLDVGTYKVGLSFCYDSRFLQGPGTDKKEVAKIRESIAAGKSFCGCILNYKKDGSRFWNLLSMTPIKSSDGGQVLKYIGLREFLPFPDVYLQLEKSFAFCVGLDPKIFNKETKFKNWNTFAYTSWGLEWKKRGAMSTGCRWR